MSLNLHESYTHSILHIVILPVYIWYNKLIKKKENVYQHKSDIDTALCINDSLLCVVILSINECEQIEWMLREVKNMCNLFAKYYIKYVQYMYNFKLIQYTNTYL